MATPPINAVGAYGLKAPFVTEVNASYKCEAINGFEALTEAGVDIFNTYYAPAGLSQAQYESDKVNAVDIVTLISMTAATIILPSSFITSFPVSGEVPYSQTFLVVDVGLLPDGFIFNSTKTEIKTVIESLIGLTPVIDTVTHPVAGIIDPSTHEQMTAARVANMVPRDNYKKLYETEASANRELRQRIDLLTEELTRHI